MTTELDTPTHYKDSIGYDDAVEAARRAGDGGPIEGFVERLAERVGGTASVQAVFGEPIERDGITVIPIAKVRYGFGGGAGRGPVAVGPGLASEADTDDLGQSGMGTGGGGGATAEPVGYLEIGPDGASFQPITEARPSPVFLLAAGVAATLVFSGLAKLIRR